MSESEPSPWSDPSKSQPQGWPTPAPGQSPYVSPPPVQAPHQQGTGNQSFGAQPSSFGAQQAAPSWPNVQPESGQPQWQSPAPPSGPSPSQAPGQVQGRLLSVRPDPVAQGFGIGYGVVALLCLITMALRFSDGEVFGAFTSLVMSGVAGVAGWAMWSSRESTLVANDWGLSREAWSALPTMGSGWRFSWQQIAGATIVQGQRNLMLVVRPQPPQGVHASRWMQGIDARLSSGSVMCPLDPQAAQQVHDLLRSRGVPEIR